MNDELFKLEGAPAEPTKGKTRAALKVSRDGYEEVKSRLGVQPMSIILADKESAEDPTKAQAETAVLPNSPFGASGRTVRGEGAGLSRFPQNIGRFVIEFYSKPRDTVLDPFAGHNSRMECCFRCGRHYKGNDISVKFQQMNAEIADRLIDEAKSELIARDFIPEIELTIGDSRKLPWESGFGDFTLTSPPYYNLEYYGDEPEQLGIAARSYWDFIERLTGVCRENFRVLKPGRFAVWFVNDFRLDGKFREYHCDTIKAMQKAGFNLHDVLIVSWGSSVRSCFPNQALETKILPKIHEYGLIFQKPI